MGTLSAVAVLCRRSRTLRVKAAIAVLFACSLSWRMACCAPESRSPATRSPETEEFVGPLAGWMDLRRDFGAVGDGRADDAVALQRALDAIRPANSPHRVLYIPAGVYRITRTVHLIRLKGGEAQDIMILGEDPCRTIIRWDGGSGGVMFDYGAWYARLGRVTFDGAGRAAIAIAHGPGFVTYNELSDLVFRDVGIGIEAGHMNTAGMAETAVLRCRFVRCTKAGASIQNFNSLDWFFRNCKFEDCARGVTNSFGAGNFHVYNSLFQRSSVADVSIGNTGYFSLRYNTSIGSRAFFIASRIGAGAGITIQQNHIYDSRETPIQVGDLGPVILLDNIIRFSGTPAVRVRPDAGFLSMGNTFALSGQAIVAKPSAPRVDDRVERAVAARLPMPILPGPSPHRRRRVIELPPDASAAAIQQAINTASAAANERVVVHLPAATYSIERALTIPAGSDLQLLGDGGRTILRWTGAGPGPLMRIQGPSYATVRDLNLDGGGKVDALQIRGCEQPRARIFMEEANIRSGKEVGLRVEGIHHAHLDLQDMNHSDCGIGVQVIGMGTATNSGPTLVGIWSGASSNNQLSYDVRNGGALLVRDIWYEGAPPGFMRCTDSGVFTLNGAEIAAGDPNHGGDGSGRPTIDVAGFRGLLTLLTTNLGEPSSKLVVHDSGPATSVLMIGQGNGNDFLVNQSPAALVALIQSVKYTPGGGATPVPDIGTVNAEFLRRMLWQDRFASPDPDSLIPPGATDLHLYRVTASDAPVCVSVSP